MTKIRIRKGFNIKLKGLAEKILVKSEPADLYAIKPTDFHGITPKLEIKEGDSVKSGTTIFTDKRRPEIAFVSPVSGIISSIVRGEKRLIEKIEIKPSTIVDYELFGVSDVSKLSREEIIKKLLTSGCWPFLRQRPYAIIANPNDTPKSIFISAFDTAPLAPDIDFTIYGCEAEFQEGIKALSKLTQGKIHLNIPTDYPSSHIFAKVKGVELNEFSGPHPSGNVGVQIHHIDPVNKGDVVWHLDPQDVIVIGRLFLKGIYDNTRVIALTGSEVIKPRYYKVIAGISIKKLIENNVTNEQLRYISGNVLTGNKIDAEGYLGFYDNQITVIPEGNYSEFFGWAKIGITKYSFSRAFLSWLLPVQEYKLDTNYHGGHRPYVITGQYEKVFPMKIYPVHLIKAILIEDIELMEKLGIYEVAPEDFALCEYVCSSKTEVQSIVRNGLDLLMKEMN